MRWQELQNIVRDAPLFESSMLMHDKVTPHQVQRQLSDWTVAGKLTQLRRGIYALPHSNPHPFVVANRLVAGSYVSLQMALAYYHLIPEHVAVVTSVTTQRSGKWENKFGRFTYRHINPDLFFGINYRLLVGDQYAYVASPEKALLDLVYLRKSGDSAEYLESLRLQNLEQLDIPQLCLLADRAGKPKLQRAVAIIEQIAERELEEYDLL